MSADDPGTQPPEPGAEPEAERKRPSLVSSAVLTYGTNLGVAVLSLVNVLIVARVLGPVGRGDVVFVITVVTMSGHLAALAVQEANGNIAAREPGLRATLATNSILFALLFGLTGAAIVAGISAVFPAVGGPVSRGLLLISLLSLPIVILRLYLNFLVQADYAFKATNAAWISGPTTTAVLNGTLGVLGLLSVNSAVAAWILGQSLGLLILVVFVVRTTGFGAPHLLTARRSVAFGAKVQVSKIMDVGNYRADQWILGAISGSKELGIYSVAVAWADVLFYLPGVLVLIQRPDLARADQHEAGAFASRVFRTAVFLAAGLALVLVVLAPFLCVTIFGEDYRGAVPMLRILALGAFGICALELLSSALVAQRRPLAASVPIAVAVIIGLGLDFLLIPGSGGIGASIGAVVGYTAGGTAAALVFSRLLHSPLRDLAPRGEDLRWILAKGRQLASRGSG